VSSDSALPTRPADIPREISLGSLADAYHEHAGRLLGNRHRLGEPLTTEQHAAHTLAVLAYGTALTERAQSGRWIYVCEALATGTPAAQVAAAMDVHEDDLLVGLVLWAGNQRRFGHITDEQHAVVMELVACRGGAQWFAKRDENLQ